MAHVALALIVLAACSAGPPGPGLDPDRVVAHVDALVRLGPHPGDTPASQRALAYLEGVLALSGVRGERVPVGTVELPRIEVLGQLHREARRVTRTDPNLVVRFGPPGKALLVMAHYDTVPTSPGAVDNSAAVGLLLELARALAATPPPQPVLLAFTANEEVGLVGAEALAAQRGDQVALAIALDVVGAPTALSLNGASTLIGEPELRWLAAAGDRAGVVIRGPLPHRVISRWWPEAERSDHGPFTRRGIRAFHLYNRGHDGDSIDLAYHSLRDVTARVDRDALGELGRLLRALVAVPPPAPGIDGVWLPVAVNTVAPRWLVVALELALAALAVVLIVRSRERWARGGLGLLVASACYAAAAGATYAIERAFADAHPAPWLHAPAYWTVALALVFGGVLGLLLRLAARLRPWTGGQRYLALATAMLLVPGLALVAVGAAELAWIWIAPAALLALAPRWGRARAVVAIPALLPLVLVLAPRQLREAAWNGFLPPAIGLSVWLAWLAIPVVAAQGWYMRGRRPSGPLGTLVLSLGCGLAISVGTVMLLRASPTCSAQQFQALHLACETRTDLH